MSEVEVRVQIGVTTSVLVCSALQPGFPIVHASASFERLTGYRQDELVGRSCRFLQGPGTDPAAVEAMARALRDGEECLVTLLNYRKDGSPFHNQVFLAPLRDEAGRIVEYIGVQHDVSPHLETVDRLARSERSYQSLVEHLPATVTYLGEFGADGLNLTYVSPQVRDLIGVDPEEFLRDPQLWGAHVHPDDRLAYSERRVGRAATGGDVDFEYRVIARDGRIVWVWERNTLVHARDGTGMNHGSIVDITERKRQEAELARVALYDSLTGLANRRLLDDRLRKTLARAARMKCPLGVIMMDVDQFKRVNDTLGHDAGDDLLREVGRRIESHVRESDSVARFGGDEFIVLCDPCESETTMVALGHRLSAALSAPLDLQGHRLTVTASCGIAFADPSDPEAAEAVLREADAAMYEAKQQGPGRLHVFDRTTRGHAARRLRLEVALNRALDRGELHVEYQPKVDLRSGETAFVEALVRWRDAEQGTIAPGDFIPMAETTGLIGRVGAHVIEVACRDAAAWRAGTLPDVGVCVNLSGPELSDARLIDQVRGALARHALPPASFGLEWTETAALADPERARRNLHGLRELGCHLSVDDFGTGHASLRHVSDFPTHEIKIDQTFVAQLQDEGSRGAAFVGAIFGMASSLELTTVAEGVETPEQLRSLQLLGCRYGQGFLLARPSAAARLPSLLREAAAVIARYRRP